MDAQFREYACSSAFRIDLSPSMIEALLNLVIPEEYRRYEANTRMTSQAISALRRRGLVKWEDIGNGVVDGPIPTEAGYHVLELLILAGFATQGHKTRLGTPTTEEGK